MDEVDEDELEGVEVEDDVVLDVDELVDVVATEVVEVLVDEENMTDVLEVVVELWRAERLEESSGMEVVVVVVTKDEEGADVPVDVLKPGVETEVSVVDCGAMFATKPPASTITTTTTSTAAAAKRPDVAVLISIS